MRRNRGPLAYKLCLFGFLGPGSFAKKMKKFILSFSIVLVFGLYVLSQESESVAVVTPPSVIGQNNQTNSASGSTNGPLAAGTPAGGKTAAPNPPPPASGSGSVQTGLYRNGQYVGNVTDAYYGSVQVRVTVRNGKLADVQFLQYPNDRNTSVRINSQAMPYLKQEAIQAQSAQVDIVSGATDTSQAFIQSLSFALDQAKA